MPKTNHDIELYLFRHAETVMNTNPHLVGGRSNESPLTEKGVEQAKLLGRTLLEKGILPDKVFASPALRTLDTARYSLAEMGLDIRPTIHDDLQELSQGIWEGRPRAEVYTPEVLTQIDQLGKDFKLEDGESMNEVGKRMHGWMTGALEEPTGRERYFVYTHGGAIKYLISHLLDWPHQQTLQTTIDNTSGSLLLRENGDWKVAYINRMPQDLA